MLNFLKGKLQRMGERQAREELAYFVDMLKGTEPEERGMTVCFATAVRNTFLAGEEFLQAKSEQMETLFLLKLYRAAQKEGQLPVAAGIAVWLHTERANYYLTLRPLAKEMWSLLAEGFPYVEETCENLLFMGIVRELNITGYQDIPLGFRTSHS